MGTTGGKFVIDYEVMTANLRAQLNRVDDMLRQSTHTLNIGVSPENTRVLDAQGRVLKQVTTAQREATEATRANAAAEEKAQQVAALRTQRFRQLTVEFENGNISQRKYTRAAQQLGVEQSKINSTINRVRNSQTGLNRVWNSASTELRRMSMALRRMLIWWGSAALLLGGQRLVKSILDVAGSFQYVVRELMVLGDEGQRVYADLARAGFAAAAETGRSFDEAADAMKGWIRQGYAASEVNDLVRTTLIGLNLTGLSSTELVRTLTAQMRAYNIPAENSIEIIDKLVGVSRRYAIETSQLAVGMRRFAASSAEAGVSMEQQAGLMVAMMTRTQQAAQMVGRAGRTILVRMRRNAAESLKNIADISVYADEAQTKYRSLWDVLGDLAQQWGTLNDAERARIAFQSAGLRQQEFFLALMNDFDLAQEAQIEALRSAGLAYRSNTLLVDTYRKSVAGLRTQWEQLLSQQSGILDFFTDLVNGLRELLDVSIRLPVSVIATGTALATLGVGIMLIATSVAPVVGTVLALAGAFTGLLYVMGQTRTTSLSNMIRETEELLKTQESQARSVEELSKQYIRMFETMKDGANKTNLLRRAKAAINELNPTLISSEGTLRDIYDQLKGKTKELAEETNHLAQMRLQAAEALRQEQILSTQAEVTAARKGLDASFDNLRFSDDTKALSAQAIILRKDLITATTDLQKVRAIAAKDYEDISDAEFQYLNRFKDGIAEARDQLERMRNTQITGAFTGRGLGIWELLFIDKGEFTGAEILEQYIENQAKALAKEGERIKTLSILANALQRLNYLQSKQIDVGGVESAGDLSVGKEITLTWQERLSIAQAQLRVSMLQKILDEGGIVSDQERLNIAQAIFDLTKSELFALGNMLEYREQQAEIDKELLMHQEGYSAFLEHQITTINGLIKIEEERRREEEKASKAVESAREKSRQAGLREHLAMMRFARERRDAIIESEAKQLEATVGQVAADKFRADEARKNYQEILKDLSELRAIKDRDAVHEQRLSEMLSRSREAARRLYRADAALAASVLAEQNALTEHQLALLEEQQNLRIEQVRLTEGDLAAENMRLALIQEEIDALEGRSRTEKEDARLRELSLAAEQQANVVSLQSLSDRIRLGEQLESITDRENALLLTRIERESGAEAAARKDVELKELALQKALALDAVEKDAFAVREAQLELDKSREKLRDIQERKETAHQETMQRLAGELASVEINHEARMIELSGSRADAVAYLLSELDKQKMVAEDIVDVKKREIALAEVELQQRKLITGEAERLRQTELETLQIVSQYISQQATAAIQGNLTAGGAVSGGLSMLGSLSGSPELSILLSAAGPIIGAIFDRSTDDLEEELDRNTMALERNTATLEDVFAQQIAVPSLFTMPANIQRFGQIPSAQMGGYVQRGGLVNVHSGESIVPNNSIGSVTINISGGNAREIAAEVQNILEKQFQVDSRRGYVPNQYGR